MSVRFDLDKPDERRAWEKLQAVSGSKNKAIIQALNGWDDIADIIRQTIRDCLQGATLTVPEPVEVTISEEESDFMDSLDAFLGE